ncbi:MAG: DUF768 domain-containing protein [Mesorhizobium sp.]|nr:DUF768 domain-containing protein [bacterium M00.F.Ca.ET.205.01.1.1]TGU53633.1 DUF768 domain-containing protein [bacterium M00.F.Ca.ET.152.01.1.1]TGV37132.1 DUF768 domain-containing protein [Mesorhizobium sp. M00.F.Ca.ET.186.01.1.1]TGZ41440.1 DUF768 domain-containing protein [bacterium M00.F.Ca.ET.162.01.1.1]TIW61246.1 MAG: DUF768 domain-containing protein [Mesorhizobium sp.]
MSTRGINFLDQWLANNVPETTNADVLSVDELRRGRPPRQNPTHRPPATVLVYPAGYPCCTWSGYPTVLMDEE